MANYKAAFESASLDLSAIMSLLGFTSYPGIDPMLRAITDLVLAKAEAQTLREERDRIERNRDMWKGQCERQAEQLEALRARVVIVPERLGTTTSQGLMDVMTLHHHLGWNACLDELARLNGKVVSEGLLRRIVAEPAGGAVYDAIAELRALLGEGKEDGDA